VPATSHGDRQLTLASEPERGDDIRHAAALRDARWVPVEDRVPNDPSAVIVGITGKYQAAAE
jgi:hypothetical protein